MNQSVTRAEIVKRASKMKKPKPKFIFGKYNGKTLKWVEANDPQYLVWVGNNVAKTYWPQGLAEILQTKKYAYDPDDDYDDMDLMDNPCEY